MEKISVIVPIYNEEVYLDLCVSSIQNQSYENLEIILVDDGSDYFCAKKCDEYAQHDSRIKVIHKKNGGVTSARKEGILAATGDYVTLVDADDWIESDTCNEYHKLMINKPDMIASSNYRREYANGSSMDVFNNTKTGFWESDKFETEVLPNFVKTTEFYDTEYLHFCVVYAFKRTFVQNLVMELDERIKIGEDFAFIMLAYMKAESFAVTPYRGYHYRSNPASVTQCTTDSKEQCKLMYDFLNKQIDKSKYNHQLLRRKNELILHRALMVTDYKPLLNASDEYLYPYSKVKKGSRIIIYGAGLVGKKICQALENTRDYIVVGIADKNIHPFELSGYRIMSPEEIIDYDYDYVVLSIVFVNVKSEIKKRLIEIGVEQDKIAEMDIGIMDVNKIYK